MFRVKYVITISQHQLNAIHIVLYGRRLPAYCVGFEVPSAVTIYGFWDMKLCRLENVYQYSLETMANAYQTTDLNIPEDTVMKCLKARIEESLPRQWTDVFPS
jgi:hypothetical protein